MISPVPVALEGHGVRLEPLAPAPRRRPRRRGRRRPALGALVHLRPEPGRDARPTSPTRSPASAPGTCCPGRCASSPAARSSAARAITTSSPPIDRVEIGYTWYARRWQRSHVNTACKLLLLAHAFDDARLPGRRAAHRQLQLRLAARDRGARREEGRRDPPSPGAPRRHRCATRVMYSILADEWPDVRKHLLARLARNARP